MENKNLPAFASVAISGENGYQQDGLTKREYFAGLALQGIMSNQSLMNMGTSYGDHLVDAVAAEYATRMADLLLEQLEKQP